MKMRGHCLFFLFLVLSPRLCVPNTFAQGASAQKVIFAVWPAEKGKQPADPVIDPIVILDGSHFVKLPEYDYKNQKESDVAIDQFEKNYFKLGRKYSLLMGGNDKGFLVVQGSTGLSCVSMAATAKLPVMIAKPQMALATTSSQGLGLHENWRTKAAVEMHPIFLKLVKTYLAQNELKGISDAAIKVEELYSTKFEAKGFDALIGNITVKQKTGIHHAFLVAENRGQQYEQVLGSYHTEADDESADVVVESFLDQLDMDNDGFDEIVTINSHYESWTYNIYKFEHGKWQKIYEGGGGGC
jgi:hypothetical protein